MNRNASTDLYEAIHENHLNQCSTFARKFPELNFKVKIKQNRKCYVQSVSDIIIFPHHMHRVHMRTYKMRAD